MSGRILRSTAEALVRGTSVYFADRVIPMLPEVLSNGACSLNAGTDKLAFSALTARQRRKNHGLRFQKDDYQLEGARRVQRGQHILDGTATPEILEKYAPVMESLRAAKALADILKANSSARGTMDFDSGESRFVLDENGVCIDIMPRVSGEAEQLIEQMMITANIAAAKFSLDHKLPFLYRVHGTPDPKRVEELIKLLKLVGVPCQEIVKPKPETQDFAAILDRVRGLPSRARLFLSVCCARWKKRDIATEETGHFGLALSDYSHYTSPIRRYPDTSIHRVLSAFVEGMPAEEMRRRYAQFCETSATESSRNEIRALIAERDAEDCYMAEYMSQHIGEHFEGTVSGVTMRGVFVRLENSVEGFVSLDAFEGEDFVYDGLITHRSREARIDHRHAAADHRGFRLRCDRQGRLRAGSKRSSTFKV